MFLLSLLLFLAIVYGGLGIARDKFFPNAFKLPHNLPVLIVGIVGFVLTSLIIKINAQEVGVVVTPAGVSDKELHTGWHIVAPWSTVYDMDKTEWVYTFSTKPTEGTMQGTDAIWAPTKDGIKMGFDVSVSWKIDKDYASWIYQNISDMDGGDNGRYLWIENNIIRTKTKSQIALMVSQYSPIECYSYKRQEIQDRVFVILKKELALKHIILEQVDIREVFYNKDYEKSINAKKLAEQEALRLIEVTKQKEELLKQAGIEKDIEIQKAEGESKALQIKGQSISNNPKIIELEWINKWNGQLPTYMMGNGQGVILNLDNK